MHRRFLCLFLALLFSALPALAEFPEIPEEYHGTWESVYGMSGGNAVDVTNQIVISAGCVTLFRSDGEVYGEYFCAIDPQGTLMLTDAMQLTLLGEGVMLFRNTSNAAGYSLVYHRIGSENPFVGTWTSVLYFIGGIKQNDHMSSITFYEDEMCDIIFEDWQEDCVDCYYHNDLCIFNGFTAFIDDSGMMIITGKADGEDHVVILTRTDK